MHQNTTIGFLIPITSKHRNWVRLRESYLIKYFLRSLIKTVNFKQKYKIYLVIDSDDKFFCEANFDDIFASNCNFLIDFCKNCIILKYFIHIFDFSLSFCRIY